jgi:hypothetical protein
LILIFHPIRYRFPWQNMQICLLMPASSHYSPSIDVYLLAYCGKPFLRTRPAAAASRSCACDQIEKARRGGGAGSSFARALHGASVLQASVNRWPAGLQYSSFCGVTASGA